MITILMTKARPGRVAENSPPAQDFDVGIVCSEQNLVQALTGPLFHRFFVFFPTMSRTVDWLGLVRPCPSPSSLPMESDGGVGGCLLCRLVIPSWGRSLPVWFLHHRTISLLNFSVSPHLDVRRPKRGMTWLAYAGIWTVFCCCCCLSRYPRPLWPNGAATLQDSTKGGGRA